MPGARLFAIIPVGLLLCAALAASTSWQEASAIEEATRSLRAPPGMAPAAEAPGAAARRLKSFEAGDNPAVQELLGLLASRDAGSPVAAAEAASRYARSLSLRPVSPNTWANLAEAKYLEGDTGAVFEHALVTASRLGPAEPQVQRMVANYGLAVRDEVAPATRSAIDSAVAAGMRRNPLEILQIAGRRGRLDVACRHLSGLAMQPDPKWAGICQRKETRQ